MKKFRILLGLIILAIILSGLNVNSAFIFGSPPQLLNAYNNNNLVRLHIIANSNSLRDQYLKRVIREEVSAFLAGCRDEEGLLARLPALEKYLNEFLIRERAGYQVAVSYGSYNFPRRTYEEMTLPAGEYQALKLILGKGQGSNWWCVLLPPLCVERGQEPARKNIEFRLKLVELVRENRGINLARNFLEKLSRLVY